MTDSAPEAGNNRRSSQVTVDGPGDHGPSQQDGPMFALSEKPMMGARQTPNSLVSKQGPGLEWSKQALGGVQETIASLAKESNERQRLVEQLQEDIAQLRKQLEQAEAGVRKNEQEVLRKTEVIEKLTQQNNEVRRQLLNEQAAFAKLKEAVGLKDENLQNAKKMNEQLQDQQTNEQNVRQELLSMIEQMQTEINSLSRDKAAAQHQVSELNLRVKVDQGNFEEERAQWKAKQSSFLETLRSEEQRILQEVADHQTTRDELENVRKRNELLEHELKSRDRQLKEAVKEYNTARTEMTRLKSQNTELRERAKQDHEEKAETYKVLQQSEQQLRVMSEKVFMLMSQLQDLETQHKDLQTQHDDTERQLMVLRRHADTAQKKLAEEKKRSSQLDKQARTLRDRMDKLALERNRYKQKYIQQAKNLKEVENTLKGRNSALAKLENQQQATLSHLVTVKSSSSQKQAVQKELEARVKALENEKRSLQKSNGSLQQDNKTLVEALERKENYIAQAKKREQMFQRVKQAVANSTADDNIVAAIRDMDAEMKSVVVAGHAMPDDSHLFDVMERTHSQKSGAGGHGRSSQIRSRSVGASRTASSSRANTVARSPSRGGVGNGRMVRQLLKTPSGQRLVTQLVPFSVKDTDLVRWSQSPAEFFKGLSFLTTQMKQMKQDADAVTQLRMQQQRNRELVARLSNSEEHRSKALMRFAALLESSEHSTSQPQTGGGDGVTDDVGSSTFLTQGGAGGDDHEATALTLTGGDRNETKRDDTPLQVQAATTQSVSRVTLSDNGVDDNDVRFLIDAVFKVRQMRRLELASNHLTGHSLLKLVSTAISEKSGLTHLDLRRNRIGISDLEGAASLLLSSAGVGGVIGATLAHEYQTSLCPYIVVGLQDRTLHIDLRHNPLFHKGTNPFKKQDQFSRIHAVLLQCSHVANAAQISYDSSRTAEFTDVMIKPDGPPQDEQEDVKADDGHARQHAASEHVVLSRAAQGKSPPRSSRSRASVGNSSVRSTARTNRSGIRARSTTPGFARPRGRQSRVTHAALLVPPQSWTPHIRKTQPPTRGRGRERTMTSVPRKHISSLPALPRASNEQGYEQRWGGSSHMPTFMRPRGQAKKTLPEIGGVY